MLRATLKQQVTLQERHIASTGTLISKKQPISTATMHGDISYACQPLTFQCNKTYFITGNKS